VRLLSPEAHTLASVLLPDPVRMNLRTSASKPIRKVGITTEAMIVGPAPRVLSLTPQVAFPSQADASVFGVSRWFRILLRFRGHRQPPGAFQRIAQFAIIRFLFLVSAATPERCGG